MATSFLRFCRIGSDGVAFVVGASGVLCWDWDAGRTYTWSVKEAIGSGLLVAWAVVVGFNSMGNGFEISSLGLIHCFCFTALLSQQWGGCFLLLPQADSSTN